MLQSHLETVLQCKVCKHRDRGIDGICYTVTLEDGYTEKFVFKGRGSDPNSEFFDHVVERIEGYRTQKAMFG